MGQLQRSELGEVRSSVLGVFNLSSLFCGQICKPGAQVEAGGEIHIWESAHGWFMRPSSPESRV